MLAAVTDEESVRVLNLSAPGGTTAVRVAPRTIYGLARVQQEFGELGSTAGIHVTALHRDLAAREPLAGLLSREAFTVAGDTILRFKRGEYELRSSGGASLVRGEPAAIERIQRTSAHDAQCPDKTYARLDPTRATMAGVTSDTRVERTGGRHWMLMERPRGWSSTMTLGNRPTSQTRWSGATTIAGNEDGGRTRRASASFSFRPGPRWEPSLNPLVEQLVDAQQYIATIAGGPAETFGSRYVFAFIDRTTVSTAYRLGFTLKPDMNLDVYAEPFASSGRYSDIGALVAAGTRVRTPFDAAGLPSPAQDFNVRSFRSNVVLRWEWRPGSTLYAVWQEDRSASAILGTRAGIGDMFPPSPRPAPTISSSKRHSGCRSSKQDLARKSLKH